MSFLRRITFNLRYIRRPPWDSGITPPEFQAFLEGRTPGRAIDLGCGTGTNVITLARLGWQVTGIDIASRAINQARKKVIQAGVVADLRVGDVSRLDGIYGPYDLVFDLGCFHGLSESEKGGYLRQIDRILRPGGIWFLYAFLRPPDGNSALGLTPADLDQMNARFSLHSRLDGWGHGDRPSAYFIFKKTKKLESENR